MSSLADYAHTFLLSLHYECNQFLIGVNEYRYSTDFISGLSHWLCFTNMINLTKFDLTKVKKK
jgi:hypothetical protein